MRQFDFGNIASSYDSFYESEKGRIYDRLEKSAVARMMPSSKDNPKMLEVGSGTGHWSKFFSAHGFHVTGVDISPEMVDIAKSKNIPNTEFHVEDILKLPYEKNSFDIVCAMASIEFTHAPQLALNTMAQFVKRGGYILLGCLNRNGLLNAKRILEKKETYVNAQLPDIVSFRKMLSQFGKPEIQACAFVPMSASWLNFVTEPIAKMLNANWGEFIVGRVKL